METRHLGRHGLKVPRICLGTMTFGLQVDEAGSQAILDHAYERGLTFLDTADVYPVGGSRETTGRTEEILGRWMKARGNRRQLIVATKCFFPSGDGLNDRGLSRAHIVEAIDASLRRLGTDYVDLYQSHGFDELTPIEETLRAFEDLVRAGKVRYAGCSNYSAWRIAQALASAQRLGVSGYASVQPRYNLLYREIETELLPLCRAEGLGVLVYNPMAGGFLSGKYRRGEAPRAGTRFTLGSAAERYQERYWQDAQFDAVEKLKRAADARGLTMPSLAVAWVLAQEGVTSAILGASRAEHLDAGLAAFDVQFDDELTNACDQAWWSLPKRAVLEGYR